MTEQNYEEKKQLAFYLLKKGDSISDATLKFSRIKLSEAEFQEALKSGTINQTHYNKAIELGIVKKGKTSVPRKNRFDSTDVEQIGKAFESELDRFLSERKVILDTIREKTGYDFQPFWRNIFNKGKGKKRNEVVSEPFEVKG